MSMYHCCGRDDAFRIVYSISSMLSCSRHLFPHRDNHLDQPKTGNTGATSFLAPAPRSIDPDPEVDASLLKNH